MTAANYYVASFFTIFFSLYAPLFLSFLSERHGRVVNIPSYAGGPGFYTLPRRPAILIDVFTAFLSPSRQMPGYYLKIRPRTPSTKSFPSHHHSLIILSPTLYSLVTKRASSDKLPTVNYLLPAPYCLPFIQFKSKAVPLHAM
jgi:hypothetical protein